MRLNARVLAIALAAALAVTATAAARADSDERDHNLARQAVERGEIKPLAEILRIVNGKLPGEVTGVKLERRHGRLSYELRILGTQGRLLEVHVDAATGEIGRTREK